MQMVVLTEKPEMTIAEMVLNRTKCFRRMDGKLFLLKQSPLRSFTSVEGFARNYTVRIDRKDKRSYSTDCYVACLV